MADRYDRRRIILIGVAIELAAAGRPGPAGRAGQRCRCSAILAYRLLFGVARAIANPAARAMMPSLVPKDDLPSGVAWSSTSWQTAVICGPGLGGLLYAIGAGLCLWRHCTVLLVAALVAPPS